MARKRTCSNAVRAGLVALGLLVRGAGQAKADYTYTTIDVPGTSFTQAFGINDAGQIVGGYIDANGGHGFLFSGNNYAPINVAGASATLAYGINDANQIVGAYSPAQGAPARGFLLSGGSYTPVYVPGSDGTAASGINNAGQIVGSYATTSGNFNRGFLFSGGSYTTLIPPGQSCFFGGINNAGQIVGTLDLTIGFLLSGGIYTMLHPPGSDETKAYGINDAGQIVGGYFDGRFHGFLLSGDDVYTNLDVPGSSETIANGINDAGQIVGQYADAGGNVHGFLAIPVVAPVPEPSAILLLGIGTLGMIGWTRRHESRRRKRQAECFALRNSSACGEDTTVRPWQMVVLPSRRFLIYQVDRAGIEPAT